MSKETNQFIEQLKAYNKENLTKDIYVPSLERTVKFSTLTAKHQRDVISSTIDNPLVKQVFHRKSYQMLKELCSESDIIDTLSIFDKDAILIQLRYHFVSKTYKDQDLEPVIEFIKTMRMDYSPKTDTVDDITVLYRIPSIKVEQKILKSFFKDDLPIVPSDDEDIRKLMGDLYYMEMIKFIAKIQLISTDSIVEFDNHTYDENVKIIDVLGHEVCSVIRKHIEGVNEIYSNLYKVGEETIDIEASLLS